MSGKAICRGVQSRLFELRYLLYTTAPVYRALCVASVVPRLLQHAQIRGVSTCPQLWHSRPPATKMMILGGYHAPDCCAMMPAMALLHPSLLRVRLHHTIPLRFNTSVATQAQLQASNFDYFA